MRLIMISMLLNVFALQAQNFEINIKSGVYKWKSSFNSKYPSYELNFKIKKGENRSLGVFKGKSKIPHYFIEFDSEMEKNKHKNIAGIFGFSDGEFFYLPSEYCDHCNFKDKMYFKADYIGEKYLYYDFFSPRVDGIPFSVNSTLKGFDGGEGTMVISLKTRDKFILSKKEIKKKLKEYPDLFEKFKKERNKTSVLKKYIQLLDKK